MSTVVGILDREGWRSRTDVIVLVEPLERRLLWIPRDLYCPRLGDRINAAFLRGGHAGLIDALAEHAIRADHSICLERVAVERYLSGVSVEVPVVEELAFEYPLSPTRPIETGRKIVRFSPPSAILRGESLHQWIGARSAVPGFERFAGDLERCRRQQILLARLLAERLLYRPEDGELSFDSPLALDEVSLVDAGWSFETLGDLVEIEIGGALVLVPRDRALWLPIKRIDGALRRLAARIADRFSPAGRAGD